MHGTEPPGCACGTDADGPREIVARFRERAECTPDYFAGEGSDFAAIHPRKTGLRFSAKARCASFVSSRVESSTVWLCSCRYPSRSGIFP